MHFRRRYSVDLRISSKLPSQCRRDAISMSSLISLRRDRVSRRSRFSIGTNLVRSLSALRNAKRCGYITRCSDRGSWWWAAIRTESFDQYHTQSLRRCVHHARINYQLISPTHAIRNVHAHIRLLPPWSLPLVSPYFPHLSLSPQERKTSQTREPTWRHGRDAAIHV